MSTPLQKIKERLGMRSTVFPRLAQEHEEILRNYRRIYKADRHRPKPLTSKDEEDEKFQYIMKKCEIFVPSWNAPELDHEIRMLWQGCAHSDIVLHALHKVWSKHPSRNNNRSHWRHKEHMGEVDVEMPFLWSLHVLHHDISWTNGPTNTKTLYALWLMDEHKALKHIEQHIDAYRQNKECMHLIQQMWIHEECMKSELHEIVAYGSKTLPNYIASAQTHEVINPSDEACMIHYNKMINASLREMSVHDRAMQRCTAFRQGSSNYDSPQCLAQALHELNISKNEIQQLLPVDEITMDYLSSEIDIGKSMGNANLLFQIVTSIAHCTENYQTQVYDKVISTGYFDEQHPNDWLACSPGWTLHPQAFQQMLKHPAFALNAIYTWFDISKKESTNERTRLSILHPYSGIPEFQECINTHKHAKPKEYFTQWLNILSTLGCPLPADPMQIWTELEFREQMDMPRELSSVKNANESSLEIPDMEM